jgi:hypothetical protein
MAIFETNADYFRFFANESRRGGSPLYERLSLGIAEDETLQSLSAKRRKGQPAANLILGAVHYLLLGGVKDELAEYYPSLGGTRPVDDRAFDLFRAFCRTHEAAIVEIVSKRVTNTNEAGRSAFLAPAFEVVSNEAGAPLALIEIGPSAGLNLNFDRYGYRYTDEAGAVRLERRLNSSLVLNCLLKGPGVPRLSSFPPPVGSRIGLELSPIDVTQELEQRWLKALVWPERIDRLATLDGALKIAAVHPPSIIGGDASANLAGALAGVSRDQARCVYHTVMAYQLTREQYQGIDATLMEASQKSPVWRVTVEGEVSGTNPKETFTTLKVFRYMKGARTVRTYGVCDSHGTWFEWKA